MAVRPVDTIEAASGMASDYPPADCPRTHAQLLEGFSPARRGRMKLAPVLKRLEQNLNISIDATAVWLSQGGQTDRLLIFSGTTLYSTPLYAAWRYDERIDGQHSCYLLPALTTVGTVAGLASTSFACIQIQTELIFSCGGLLSRYYWALDGLGAEKLYSLGISVMSLAPTLTQAPGGALTLLQTYEYEVTLVDELGREGSPSPSGAITLVSSNNSVDVTRAGTSTAPSGGEVSWNVYRRNPGSSVFNFVATVPLATGVYTDVASDDTVNLGQSAPLPGENDPPGVLPPPFAGESSIMCEWNGRLVLNDDFAPNMYQISNAGSPVQFSAINLPTNPSDGIRATIGGHGQNAVTGLANLGSALAIFGRETTNLLFGDDSSNFTLRQTLQRGCQNANSVQRCENQIIFLSDDGIYAIGYEDGYAVKKVSMEVDNYFRGFTQTLFGGAGMARSTAVLPGRLASVQVVNALFSNVRSFYSENRYYIAIGNKTLCYDTQTGGWADTGWGYMKTATRYLSQMGLLAGSPPETVFITIGDINTRARHLDYFTVADTPLDIDAPGIVHSRIVMRPYDASGASEQRAKRPCSVAQYGTTKARRGSVIGTLKWWADGELVSEVPIYAHITCTNEHKGALFEMGAPPMAAETPWLEMLFTAPDIELQKTLVEMAYVS